MDFTPRGDAPQPGHAPASRATAATKKTKKAPAILRWGAFALLIAVLILVVATIIMIATNGKQGQGQYVDKNNLQAVFLNGGQVYFGNIGEITDDYTTMSNIYYLRVNQQVQPDGSTTGNGDVSLVKLGCELHGPQDKMVINNEQVVFWENLKSDGQVAQAVTEYVKQNPNGQDCNAQVDQGSQNNTAPVNNGNNNANN